MMELQLGLALPTNISTPNNGLDLNTRVYEHKEPSGSTQVMMNHTFLGPFPWLSSSTTTDNNHNKKRSFYDAFDDITDEVVVVPRTLPLLLWNNQPNDEDDPKASQNNFPLPFNKVIGDGDAIVGWPPIKFRRKKLNRNVRVEKNRTVDNGCADCQGRPSNSMYVKVKMEGVVIARKINLCLYSSFPALKTTLLGMFGICQENSASYKLTYQDREGDWLLADDVPWRSFIRSVQRLKLMRAVGDRS